MGGWQQKSVSCSPEETKQDPNLSDKPKTWSSPLSLYTSSALRAMENQRSFCFVFPNVRQVDCVLRNKPLGSKTSLLKSACHFLSASSHFFTLSNIALCFPGGGGAHKMHGQNGKIKHKNKSLTQSWLLGGGGFLRYCWTSQSFSSLNQRWMTLLSRDFFCSSTKIVSRSLGLTTSCMRFRPPS